MIKIYNISGLLIGTLILMASWVLFVAMDWPDLNTGSIYACVFFSAFAIFLMAQWTKKVEISRDNIKFSYYFLPFLNINIPYSCINYIDYARGSKVPPSFIITYNVKNKVRKRMFYVSKKLNFDKVVSFFREKEIIVKLDS